jgi:hypothetical protein
MRGHNEAGRAGLFYLVSLTKTAALWPYPSSATQLALVRNSFVLLIQISNPILKLARFLALWKARDNHVGAGRGVLAAHGWSISHNLADAEFVGWHRQSPRLVR